VRHGWRSEKAHGTLSVLVSLGMAPRGEPSAPAVASMDPDPALAGQCLPMARRLGPPDRRSTRTRPRALSKVGGNEGRMTDATWGIVERLYAGVGREGCGSPGSLQIVPRCHIDRHGVH
jgi:hypothetical protein